MSDQYGEPLDAEEEVEVVDGLPVLAEFQTVEVVPSATVPAVQAAALAAGGFFAGALTMALIKRVAARKLAESASPLPDLSRHWPAGGSRTYVVTIRPVSRPR
jgi:hypothetical protein